MVAWHATTTDSFAGDPPKALIVLEVVIRIPAGSSLPVPFTPDNPPVGWFTVTKTGTMNSGDRLSDWEITYEGSVRILNGSVIGPETITCRRKIIPAN